jgi:hypothetical protein
VTAVVRDVLRLLDANDRGHRAAAASRLAVALDAQHSSSTVSAQEETLWRPQGGTGGRRRPSSRACALRRFNSRRVHSDKEDRAPGDSACGRRPNPRPDARGGDNTLPERRAEARTLGALAWQRPRHPLTWPFAGVSAQGGRVRTKRRSSARWPRARYRRSRGTTYLAARPRPLEAPRAPSSGACERVDAYLKNQLF